MTLKELEPQLSALTRAEKASVVHKLALEIADAWVGIEKKSQGGWRFGVHRPHTHSSLGFRKLSPLRME